MFLLPCFGCHVSVAMFRLPCFGCHVSVAMFLLPCFCCHVSVAMFLLPCFCCHVSVAMFLLPCFCCHVSVAMFLLPCFCCQCDVACFYCTSALLQASYASQLLSMSVLTRKSRYYAGKVNSETSGDSKAAFLHVWRCFEASQEGFQPAEPLTSSRGSSSFPHTVNMLLPPLAQRGNSRACQEEVLPLQREVAASHRPS